MYSLAARQRNLIEMGRKRSIESTSGGMTPMAAELSEPPKKRYRCELCPQWQVLTIRLRECNTKGKTVLGLTWRKVVHCS